MSYQERVEEQIEFIKGLMENRHCIPLSDKDFETLIGVLETLNSYRLCMQMLIDKY
jgi:hypothetical protein